MISINILQVSLFFIALNAFAVAEVPSYIHVCGRKNPNLDKCVLDSVRSLNDSLRNGIPELDIPPSDPLYVDHVDIATMHNFKAVADNVRLFGLSNYDVKQLHVDLDKHTIDLDVVMKKVSLDADYDVSARILVPIAGKGPIHIEADNVEAKVHMMFKLTKQSGKTYLYFPSMTTKLIINDYTAKFQPLGGENSALNTAINQALGQSRQDIIQSTTPNLEKAISSRVLTIANKICRHFTWEELFPDRE